MFLPSTIWSPTQASDFIVLIFPVPFLTTVAFLLHFSLFFLRTEAADDAGDSLVHPPYTLDPVAPPPHSCPSPHPRVVKVIAAFSPHLFYVNPLFGSLSTCSDEQLS